MKELAGFGALLVLTSAVSEVARVDAATILNSVRAGGVQAGVGG